MILTAIALCIFGATGTAPTPKGAIYDTLRAGDFRSHTLLRPGTSWFVAGDGLLVKSNHAIVAEPRGVGSWRYVFHTREHGAVDLDTLLAQMDSVLSGKLRNP